MKYIIIYGDPVDGFTFCGPFDTHEDAIDYAERAGGEWTTAQIDPPEGE